MYEVFDFRFDFLIRNFLIGLGMLYFLIGKFPYVKGKRIPFTVIAPKYFMSVKFRICLIKSGALKSGQHFQSIQ